MRIQDIIELTNAKRITPGTSVDMDIRYAFSSDLMSDVLTIDTDRLMLITGLNNVQTIRTAEMAQIGTVLFARNKRPSKEMIELAEKENMTLLVSEKSVFHVSGLLFQGGVKPVY